MPFAAFACRATAWFVLGSGLMGAVFFMRYDGLGVVIAAAFLVLALVLAVGLWALGRVCREVARLSRIVDPRKPAKAAIQQPVAAKATPRPSRWRRRSRTDDDAELSGFFS